MDVSRVGSAGLQTSANVFTANGSTTVPAWAMWLRFHLVGGGGGGGRGIAQSGAGVWATGGGGGAGGAIVQDTIYVKELRGAAVDVTVGAGGVGATVAPAANSTAGGSTSIAIAGWGSRGAGGGGGASNGANAASIVNGGAPAVPAYSQNGTYFPINTTLDIGFSSGIVHFSGVKQYLATVRGYSYGAPSFGGNGEGITNLNARIGTPLSVVQGIDTVVVANGVSYKLAGTSGVAGVANLTGNAGATTNGTGYGFGGPGGGSCGPGFVAGNGGNGGPGIAILIWEG